MTKYNPRIHHRRSIRLPRHDYTSTGSYVVTICVRGGECLLGEVSDDQMRFSDYGRVVAYYWQRIANHVSHASLDAWVIMPNHMHGILTLDASLDSAGALADGGSEEPPGSEQVKETPWDARPVQLVSGSLGAIAGNYKSITTRRINRMRHTPGQSFWQRNYWDTVIRNEATLNRIREYIDCNPARWLDDQLNPDAPKSEFDRWVAG
jgi:putative transposase